MIRLWEANLQTELQTDERSSQTPSPGLSPPVHVFHQTISFILWTNLTERVTNSVEGEAFVVIVIEAKAGVGEVAEGVDDEDILVTMMIRLPGKHIREGRVKESRCWAKNCLGQNHISPESESDKWCEWISLTRNWRRFVPDMYILNWRTFVSIKFSWRTLVSKPLFWELKLVVASSKGEKALKVDAGAEETGEATNAVKARTKRPWMESNILKRRRIVSTFPHCMNYVYPPL